MRQRFLTIIFVSALALAFAGQAECQSLFGKPLSIQGYLAQSANFGLSDGDNYETMDGFHSAIFEAMLEMKWEPTRNAQVFVSGALNADWAYDILDSDDEWIGKHMDRSSSNEYTQLHFFNDYEDILKECHVTWSPGPFTFRFGKQIVSWGETDMIRVADQINPEDLRRGFTDVEFETGIIPIWLLKGEYFFDLDSAWLTDLGIEYTFNPNVDFIHTKGGPGVGGLGNDEAGIWSPFVQLEPGVILGSWDLHLDEPDGSDGHEHAVRVKAIAWDTIFTFLYFDGIANDAIIHPTAPFPSGVDFAPDGSWVVHLPAHGFFPDFQFAGFTLTRDFPSLNISALGGVGPILRLEAINAFDTTFATAPGAPVPYEEHDEYRWVVAVDWAVKVPLLNPRSTIKISPQFVAQSIQDYPETYALSGVEDDNYDFTLFMRTTYLNAKLEPAFFYRRGITHEWSFYMFMLKYDYSYKWSFSLRAGFVNGEVVGGGFQPFENKDFVGFRVNYRF